MCPTNHKPKAKKAEASIGDKSAALAAAPFTSFENAALTVTPVQFHLITLKYWAMGGSSCFLGAAITSILTCPDGLGQYQHYPVKKRQTLSAPQQSITPPSCV